MATEETITPAARKNAKGIAALCELLEEIRTTPAVLRPGYAPGEDDAVRHDYARAGKAVLRALEKAPRGEFANALGVYLAMSQDSSSFTFDKEVFEYALQQVATEDGSGQRSAYEPELRSQSDRTCYGAASQICALAQMLIDMHDPDPDASLGLAVRIRDLAAAIMFALPMNGEIGEEDLKESIRTVTGNAPELAEAVHD